MKGVYAVEDKALLCSITEEAKNATLALCEAANAKKSSLFIVGCSSSEVLGEKIGTNSSLDVAKALFEGIYPVLCEKGIFGYEPVNVKPQPKAGGSFGTTAFENFKDAVAVEKVRADLGLDIGLTMIGMHLKEVAVPVRLPIKKIGNAPIVCARTRPKFIGGARAIYNEDLL